VTWKQTTLGEVAEIVSGATPKSDVPVYWDGAIAWVTPTDLSELSCKHISKTSRTISEAGLNACSARLLPPKSVLFSSRAPIGLIAINTIPMATNQGFKSFVPKPELNADFLFWWLKSNRKQLEDLGNGATFKEVSKAVVSRVPFALPPVEEQRRIAAILDKADDIRRKREQALTLADHLLKSVFREMFGNPATNPRDLPIVDFETVLTVPLRNGISPSSRGSVTARVLTLTAITGDRFDGNHAKEGKFLEPVSAKDEVNISDFYICRGNGSPELIGKGYFADRNIKGTAFPDTMIAAKPNPSLVTRAFLEVIWNSPFVRNQIREAARTTNGTFKINQTAAGAIKIPLPKLQDQERFQVVADKMVRAKAKLAVGDDLFATLSQRAFRGEL
jgi:type I restriction enzyme S subunit